MDFVNDAGEVVKAGYWINKLTSAKLIDKHISTPLHKHVPARLLSADELPCASSLVYDAGINLPVLVMSTSFSAAEPVLKVFFDDSSQRGTAVFSSAEPRSVNISTLEHPLARRYDDMEFSSSWESGLRK